MSYVAKPGSPVIQTSDALYSGARAVVPFTEASGIPGEFVSGTPGTLWAGNDGNGTVAPSWATGSFGATLSIPATNIQSIKFANRSVGATNVDFSMGVICKPTNAATNWNLCANGVSNAMNILISSGLFKVSAFAAGLINAANITVVSGHRQFFFINVVRTVEVTLYYYDFDATTPTLITTTAPFVYTANGAGPDFIVHTRSASQPGVGEVDFAWLHNRVLTLSEINRLIADPSLLVRAPLTVTGYTVTSPTSGLVGTPNTWTLFPVGPAAFAAGVTFTPSFTPGTGSFSPASYTTVGGETSIPFVGTPTASGQVYTVSFANTGGFTNPTIPNYTATAGTLTLPDLTLGSITKSGYTATATPSGGNGPITLTWFRDSGAAAAAQTPGTGTQVQSGSSRTYTETGRTYKSTDFLSCVATDTNGGSATSPLLAAPVRPTYNIRVFIVGDSIPNGSRTEISNAIAGQLVGIAGLDVASAVVSNGAVDGTSSADWLPGFGLYTGALAQFNGLSGTPNLKFGMVMLGINDCKVGTSAATYKANIAAIASQMLADGMDFVVLMYPTMRGIVLDAVPPRTGAHLALLLTYGPAIDSLDDGVRRFVAGRDLQALSGIHIIIQGDKVHPGDTATKNLIAQGLWDAARASLKRYGDSLAAQGGSWAASLGGTIAALFRSFQAIRRGR